MLSRWAKLARWVGVMVAAFALTGAGFAQLQPGGAAGIGAPGTGVATPVGSAGAGAGSATVGTPGVRGRRENPVISIQDMVRLENQAASQLRGIGIVTGLRGTGDTGSELVMARPLAQIYANNGNPIGDLRELGKAKAAAIVSLWCEIPESGGVKGDKFDLYVSVMHSAASLRGGRLEISPMLGPLPGQGVFAFASGLLSIEDTEVPTVGVIRGGAQLIQDIKMAPVRDAFSLIVRPEFRGYSITRMLASEINGLTADLEEDSEPSDLIAQPLDDMTVRIVIPERERANTSAFIASILTKRFSPSLMDLPAQVIVNERTGNILVTGDVEISAVTIGNDKLVVTTVTPPVTPSAAAPLVERSNWTGIGTASTNADRARIDDLLDAFKQLNVPAKEQIDVLTQLYKSGRLHAKFVVQ